MRSHFLLLCLALICRQAPAGSLEIPGTGDGLSLLRDLAKAYHHIHPGDTIYLPDSIGSSGGIQRVLEESAQLARVARRPKPGEPALSYQPWAKVPVAFYTHKALTLEGVSGKQVLDIWSGRLTNWQQIGGADEKIRVIDREQGDSSKRALWRSLPGFRQLKLRPDRLIATTTQAALEAVSIYKGAIGYGPASGAVNRRLHLLKLDGRAPGDTGYPLNNTLAFVFRQGLSNPVATRFIGFVLSAAGGEIIRRHGALPVKQSSDR